MAEVIEAHGKQFAEKDAATVATRDANAQAITKDSNHFSLQHTKGSASLDVKHLVETNVIPAFSIERAEINTETPEQKEIRVYYQQKLANDLPIFASDVTTEHV